MPKRKTVDKEYQDLTKDVNIDVLQKNIREFFQNFPDPRTRWIYPSWYLILVILCGYLSGCNTIADIAHFAEVRNGWLNALVGIEFKTVLGYDLVVSCACKASSL